MKRFLTTALRSIHFHRWDYTRSAHHEHRACRGCPCREKREVEGFGSYWMPQP